MTALPWPKPEEPHPLNAVIDLGIGIVPMWGLLPEQKLDGAYQCGCGKFSCDKPGRHPHGYLVPNGTHDATASTTQLSRWMSRYPDLNWAAVPGNKFAILDVDPRHGGAVDGLDLPATVTCLTGGGGQHLYFRVPDGVMLRGSKLSDGIEVKHGFNCCHVPPSRHVSGGAYRWAPGLGPGEIDVAELPGWAVERLRFVERPATVDGGPADFGEEPPELTRALVLSALSAIDNRGRGVHYDIWLRFGLAIYHANFPDGQDIWDGWSKQSDKYDPRVQRDTWRGFERKNGHANPVTIGTIFFMATESGGWRWDGDGREVSDAYWDRVEAEFIAYQREGAHCSSEDYATLILEAAERGEPDPTEIDAADLAARVEEKVGTKPSGEAKLETEELRRPEPAPKNEKFETQEMRKAPSRHNGIIHPTPWVYRHPSVIPPRRWLYDKHYCRCFVSATVARGGLGKSSLALVEAIAMATGRPLLGAPVQGRFKVWYWNGEDPREEIERRIAAIIIYYAIEPEELEGRLFVDSGRDLPICIATKNRDTTVFTPDADRIRNGIKERDIDVLIIDPFVSSHDVPENDNGSIDKVTKKFAGIAEWSNCAAELIHHIRKPMSGSSTGATVDDGRGAGSLHDGARSMRVLNHMTAEEAEKFGIDDTQRKLHIRIDNGKANMRPPSEQSRWIKLSQVCLNNGDGPEAHDWVGVVTGWKPSVFDGRDAGGDLEKVKAALAGGDFASYPTAKNWAGLVIGEALGIDVSERKGKSRVKGMIKEWLKAGSLIEVGGWNKDQRRTIKLLRAADDLLI